jgi:hypothetical protein
MKTNQFHSKEFQQMMFNPDRIPEGTSVISFYKELGKIKEFKASAGEGIDGDKVNLYILLMYDKNSPYRKKFHDALKRKVEVAHDCGFEVIEGGMFESPIEDMLKGKNEIVNKKIVQFVRMHRSYNYSYQVSVETAYANLMLEIQAGETKGLRQLADMRDDLERNLTEMMNEDNNPYLKDEILRYMESERLALRPEDIAKKMQNGEPPVELKTKKA